MGISQRQSYAYIYIYNILKFNLIKFIALSLQNICNFGEHWRECGWWLDHWSGRSYSHHCDHGMFGCSTRILQRSARRKCNFTWNLIWLVNVLCLLNTVHIGCGAADTHSAAVPQHGLARHPGRSFGQHK